jgi:hypothetical protein
MNSEVHARDFGTVLAVWPRFRPLYDNWLMQELVEKGGHSLSQA